MLCRAAHQRAKLPLSEADAHADIIPEEGPGRDRVSRGAAWAKGQEGTGHLGTRCRVALLQVYRERVEHMGRWTVNAVHWKLNIIALRRHQWTWDWGWLQFRAQGEAAKLWVREGVQVLGLAYCHVRVFEHRAGRAVHAQVQQEWGQIVGLETTARVMGRKVGILLG